MNIIVTGKGGNAGSWKVRGEQLGAALGASVKPYATRSDFDAHDVAVVVKRPVAVITELQRSGKPWVFDLVDLYPQPAVSGWNRDTAIAWVHERLRELKPNGIIWPTHRMREDCDTGLPGVVLPHHHRPSIRRNPIRERVMFVGYEGRPEYLGQWAGIIERECARRGWIFILSPGELADLDIVLAFRGGEWSGYAQRHWKSNIKVANAHASGTPFVGQCESGYSETSTGCEYWAETPDQLRISFDWLESQSTREQICDRFVQARYPVEKAANDLRRFLGQFA